jgi:hypothetical protein
MRIFVYRQFEVLLLGFWTVSRIEATFSSDVSLTLITISSRARFDTLRANRVRNRFAKGEMGKNVKNSDDEKMPNVRLALQSPIDDEPKSRQQNGRHEDFAPSQRLSLYRSKIPAVAFGSTGRFRDIRRTRSVDLSGVSSEYSDVLPSHLERRT